MSWPEPYPALAPESVLPARLPRGFDADYLWRWLARVEPQGRRLLMRVAAWLWRSGIHDVQAITWLLEEGRAHGVRNWYAYYGLGGTARGAALGRYQRGSAARDREETERWLRREGKS